MPEGQESTDPAPMVTDEWTLAWMEEHLPELRRSVSGPHYLYVSLVGCFVLGLAAQIGGYLLRSSVPSGPLGLLADLLYALGWSLWTGVVVVVFIEVIPEAKRRGIRRALDAYEALQRERAQAGGAREKAVSDSSPATQADREQGSK